MEYKIFLLAAFFSLDSAAMVGSGTANLRSEHPTGQHVATAAPAVMIGSGNIVDPRSEHEMVANVATAVSATPADDTIDLRATYHNAVLERNLRSFNLLLHQNSKDLQHICQPIEMWNILINSYNLENNSFNYRGLFTVVNNIKGVAMVNLSEDSMSELKRFLFAHKSAISGVLVDSLYEKWVTTKDGLVKRFANTENQSFLRCEIYYPSIKNPCVLASFIFLAFSELASGDLSLGLKWVGYSLAVFIIIGEITMNWIKGKFLIVSKEYRENITKAAEIFALYLVLSGHENAGTVGGRFGMYKEYDALQAGISAWRTNSKANIVEVAVERLS